VYFQRLRLIGFKSFVDSTDLLIEPGLTGIVGPNGCGKSNLVEALRWVMGESSPRQMRGREMEDVIFGGSAARPPRNHAEVQVLLDNAARTAPAAFNDDGEIEISRRIERGLGSVYRINGREFRARDVQLLFADETTGARSTALVGQGQVGALVSAKPSERRALLDEAAAITGLHSRRHEAELRLRAAEANLERLDDVTGALEAQLQGLKRQARQAARYRRLGDRIRQTEALLLHRRYQAGLEAVALAASARDGAERAVAALEQTGASVASEQADAAAALPPLREAEAASAAKLHRLEVAQVELEAEERRLADSRAGFESRLTQIDADVEREGVLAGDADQALARLETERGSLNAALEGEREAVAAAAAARDQAAQEVSSREHDADSLAARLAAAEARKAALSHRIAEIDARLDRLRMLAAEVDQDLAGLDGGAGNETALGAAEAAVSAAGADVGARRAEADKAEQERANRQSAEGETRESWQTVETGHTALAAEEAALAELLGEGKSGRWPAIIDQISVEAGFETALGAALGDDLSASPDADAPLHWRHQEIDGLAHELPEGAESLDRFVTAPPALARRLSQVGVVAASDGARLWGALAQGQRLVSRDGALWRWDGFAVAPEAETPAAVRLRQNNRLIALRREIEKSETRRRKAARKFDDARAALDHAAAAEAEARSTLRRAEETLDSAREARAQAAAAAATQASRRDNRRDAAARLAADLKEAAEQRNAAVSDSTELERDDGGRARLESLRADLSARRTELAERESAHDHVRRESAARRDRLAASAGRNRRGARRAPGPTSERPGRARQGGRRRRRGRNPARRSRPPVQRSAVRGRRGARGTRALRGRARPSKRGAGRGRTRGFRTTRLRARGSRRSGGRRR
jgi:chromosome segregation protein